jgi:hypothetical protein
MLTNKFIAMNTSISQFFTLALFLLFNFSSFAQCTFNSSSGYSVEVVIVPKSIATSSSSCTWGYNYNVNVEYSIVFSGTTPPAAMSTLQGTLTCGTQTLFLDLSNSPTSTTLVTTANPYRSTSDCATATVASLDCTSSTVTIQGPSLSATTSNCPPTSTLPVDLISFQGQRSLGNIELTWQTASELNNDYFTLERLVNNEWSEIEKIEGSGTTQEITNYEYTYKKASADKVIYRLKQTDYDGLFSYSNIISIDTDINADLVLWPNPATEAVTINLDNIDSESFFINNISGVDFTSKTQWSYLKSSASLDISELPSGLYFIQIGNRNFRFIKR